MANGGYNPFQASQALTRLQGQVGGAGMRWEGLQKGTSRETIRKWVEEQAEKASDAASGLGQAGVMSKLAGTAAMYLIPGMKEATLFKQFLTGATAAGLTSKFLGDRAVSPLSKETMPDVLYGVDTAREAETTAHSAVDKLISAVNPAAVSSAVTTPLSVLSMRALGNNPYSAKVDPKLTLNESVDPSKAYEALTSGFKSTPSDNPLFNENPFRNLLDMLLKR